MKQIFDWLREQINDGREFEYDERNECFNYGLDYAIRRVDEAEAKWETECCEWNFYEVDVLTAHGMYEYKGCVKQWKYCPFCGKPIKISEVE